MSGGNRVAEMYLGSFGSVDSQVHERERVHWVCSQVQGEQVLEVGCSQGIVALLLAREGFDVVGVDVASGALEFAEGLRVEEAQAVQDRLEFRLTDGSLDEFGDGSFECVVLGEVVEHLTQPQRLLADVVRVLAPGGRLVLTTTIGIYPDPDHKESLFPSDLIELLAADFEYVDSTFITFPLGRFNNIGLTLTRRESRVEGVEAAVEYWEPLLDITERCLLEVQKGHGILRERVDERQAELRAVRDELREVRSERKRTVEDLQRTVKRGIEDHARERSELTRKLEDERAALTQKLEEEQANLRRALTDLNQMPEPEIERKQVDGPELDPQALADRLATAENRAAEASYLMARFSSRRGIRVALMFIETLRRPRLWLSFPKRLVGALRRQEAPTQPTATTSSRVLASLQVPRHSSLGSAKQPDYPNFHIVHWGQSSIFEGLAPHSTLNGELDWSPYLEVHSDLVLLEPSTRYTNPPQDAIRAFQEAGVPVLLYARHSSHLQLGLNPDLIITEDPAIATQAKQQTDTDRVLLWAPSVKPTAYNPIGWQRLPSNPNPALFLPHTPNPDPTSTDWTTLITPLEDNLDVYPTTNTSPIPQLNPFTHPTVTNATQLTETTHQHPAPIVVPSLHHNETSLITTILNLAATGTPIITTPNPTLDDLIPPGHLHYTTNPQETLTHLETLSDPYLRERNSITLRQHVLNHHTRRHRFDQLLTHLGIPTKPQPTVSILLVTNRPDFLEHAYTQIGAQTYPNLELITLLHGDTFNPDPAHKLSKTLPFPTPILPAPTNRTLGDCLNHAATHATGQLVTKMDDDDYYGPNHITDLTTARTYSQADITGKRGNFVYLKKMDITAGWGAQHEETAAYHIPGATMLIGTDLVREFMFKRLSQGEDSDLIARVRNAGGTQYSTHRFNFVRVRHGDHSFVRDDSQFIAESGDLLQSGFERSSTEIRY